MLRSILAWRGVSKLEDPILRTALIYSASVLLFFVSTSLPATFPILAIRLLSGLFCVVLIPGAILTTVVVPRESRNLGRVIVLGLLLVVFEIQMLFLLTLTTSLQVPLIIWIHMLNLPLITVCLMWLRNQRIEEILKAILRVDPNKRLWPILGMFLVIRIVMMFLAQGSIAPDAALYADYSAGIIYGRFDSSITNDYGVFTLWNGVDFVAHQAFTYLCATSFLLLPPTTSGPYPILILIGAALVLSGYSITKRFFNENAAIWVALILAMHPLFVFHSVVSYGPEISSLLFMTYAGIFYCEGNAKNGKGLLLPGLLLGLVDAIWSPNFYIACLLLVVFLFALGLYKRSRIILIVVSMALVIAARIFVYDLLVFSLVSLTIVSILTIASVLKSCSNLSKIIPFFVGVIFVIFLWRFPLQLASLANRSEITAPESTPLFFVLGSVPSLNILTRFAFFIFFHLTPTLFILLIIAIIRRERDDYSFLFLLAGLIAAAGTLQVFGHFSKETLLLIYIFSDSRFFLFISLALMIAASGYLAKLGAPLRRCSGLRTQYIAVAEHRTACFVLGMIIVGFVPAYIAIPSGLALTNIEERYGWHDLAQTVSALGDENTVFLVDRAREFSWFTCRDSAVLRLSQANLPILNASTEIHGLASNFNAEYLVMDEYTIAHWMTLGYLLHSDLTVGSTTVLALPAVPSMYYNQSEITVDSVRLVAQTLPNLHGRYARVYEFCNDTYTNATKVDLLSAGWSASNDGHISASSGYTRLVIGEGQNYTNTFRPGGFDLDLDVWGGFILFELEDDSASISRIEVWSEDGSFLRYAEDMTGGMRFCPLGEESVGDIRIVIEGEPGSSITIRSISIWEALVN